MTGKTIDQLRVGDVAEQSRVVMETDIAEFVDAVGDRNPLHSDPAFAAATPFREPIAPGIWTAGLISGLIGTYLPGPGSVYAAQDLRFLRPVRMGDMITARVEVLEVVRDRNRVRLKTTCLNQGGEEVLAGEAWVLPPKAPVSYAERKSAVGALGFWALQPWVCAARAVALWTSWAVLPLLWGAVPSRRLLRS